MRIRVYVLSVVGAVATLVTGVTVAMVAHSSHASHASHPSSHGRDAEPTRQVVFAGYRTRVPASWPVYDLTADPTRCVRFDQHAVYLGTPGADQRCPAHAVGRTEALLVQPLTARSAATGSETGMLRSDLPRAGVSVTASYAGGTELPSSFVDVDAEAPQRSAGPDSATTPSQAPASGNTADPTPTGNTAVPPPDTTAPAPAGTAPAPTDVTTPPPSDIPAPAISDTTTATPSDGAASTSAAPTPSPSDDTSSASPSGPPARSTPTTSAPAPSVTATPAPAPTTSAATSSHPVSAASVAPSGTSVNGASSTLVVRPVSTALFTKGLGFDTCAAPSASAMAAWRSTTLDSVGIYVGGVNRACPDGNLSATWVRTVWGYGYSFIPTYVGLQPPCTTFTRRIDPTHAVAQGNAAADDAVTNMRRFGFGTGNPVYLDIEDYVSTASCTAAVLNYTSGWTRRLHQLGYVAGFYSTVTGGIHDVGTAYGSMRYTTPDAIWIARWNGLPNVDAKPYVPDQLWRQRRLKQYQGGHAETHGGVTINIDSDYAEGLIALPGSLTPSTVNYPVPASGN